jgi:hypothetical protein
VSEEPYKCFWVGLVRWRVTIDIRPTWGMRMERTELLLLGIGIEEGV